MFELSQQLLTEFLEGIKQELVDYMSANNRNATGKSVASLAVTANGATGVLKGSSYIDNVFRGRAPGRMPPISALIDWCNARGLPRGVAWAVAKTIAKAGTKLYQQGRNVLNEIITAEKIDAFKQTILVTFTTELRSQIKLAIAA